MKGSYKLHSIQRLRRYLLVDKARLRANALIDSQFDYAPLVWMFAGITLKNKMCKIYHSTLKVVYDDFNKSYNELLELNKDLSIYQRHPCYLAIGVFKSANHQYI